MHRFVTNMCTCVHISMSNISVTKRCITEYFPNPLRDLRDGSIYKSQQMFNNGVHNNWAILNLNIQIIYEFVMDRQCVKAADALVRVTGLCEGNPQSPIDSLHKGQCRGALVPLKLSIDLHLNKRLSKQSGRRWFGTSSRSLWRHCNDWYHFADVILYHNMV